MHSSGTISLTTSAKQPLITCLKIVSLFDWLQASIAKFYFWKKANSVLKGALSGLRQFFVTESSLKMIKNAFYFIFKALIVLKIFKIYGHVEKRLH